MGKGKRQAVERLTVDELVAIDRAAKLQAHRDRRRVLVTYLNECVRVEDWHGVMDASADLREIDVALEYLSDGRS